MSDALDLADNLWADWFSEPTPETLRNAAAELRRLHAENEELRKALGQAVAAHEMGVLLSGEGTRQLRAAMKEAKHE